MKPILDPTIQLSVMAATVRTFRNHGYDVVSAGMIAEAHGCQSRAILPKLRILHGEIRNAYPTVSSQLVSEYFITVMPNTKRFNGFRFPPESNAERHAVEEAKSCLAIGCQAHAIRFICDKRDYLCRVWEYHFLNRVAVGFLTKRVRSTAQAAENKHIPGREAALNIVQAVLAVAPAINGSKQIPKEIKEVKTLAAKTFQGEWEKNFNKRRDGAWPL